MVTQQLIDYIKHQLAQNVTKEQIKTILINNKWEAADVEEGFNVIIPKTTVSSQTITTPITQVQPIVQPAIQQPASSPAMRAEPVVNVINPITTASMSPASQPVSNPVSNMVGGVINPVVNPNLNHVSQPVSNAINPVINPRMQSIQPTMQNPASNMMNTVSQPKKHFFGKGFWISFFLFCILVGVSVYVFAYIYSPAKVEQAISPMINQQQTNNVVHPTLPATPSQTPVAQAPAQTTTPVQNPTPTITPPPASITKVTTPTTAVITVGSRNTTLGVPILVQNILSFTDSRGVVTAGADVIISDNGISQELIMKVGEKDTLKMYTITLLKVLGKNATFSVQSNTN